MMENKHLRFWVLGITALSLLMALLVSVPAATVRADSGSNWQGQYWNNNSFSGNPTLTRTDNVVNFNWGTGSPDPSIPADNFSARWTNSINFAAGTYNFRAGAEDGIRVQIDGNTIIDRLTASSSFVVNNNSVTLGAGSHTIVVSFVAFTGSAGVLFDWTGSGASSTAPTSTPVPGSVAVPSSLKPVKAVVIASIANVRSGPSTDSTILRQILKDEVDTAVASDGTGLWFQLQFADGSLGWVFHHNIFLYFGDPGLLPVIGGSIKPPAPLADVQGVSNVQIIVRDGPSRINSKKIGVIDQGQYFKILALSRTRAWVQINADGLIGWVFLPNITVVSGDLGNLPVSTLPH